MQPQMILDSDLSTDEILKRAGAAILCKMSYIPSWNVRLTTSSCCSLES